MAEAKQEEAWDHTSTILAMLFNVNSTKKKLKPIDFHPFRKRISKGKKRTNTGAPLDEFKRAIVGSNVSRRTGERL